MDEHIPTGGPFAMVFEAYFITIKNDIIYDCTWYLSDSKFTIAP